MALFGFGKKKEEKQTEPACCGAPAPEASGAADPCAGSAADRIRSVKVLGAGCATCHKQYVFVQEAVKHMGLPVEVEFITDMAKVMEYGAMRMPVIVVNEKVVSMGGLLKASTVEKLLGKF